MYTGQSDISAAGSSKRPAAAAGQETADSFHLVNWLTRERERGILIWLFNIGAEAYWHAMPQGVVDREEDRIVGRTEEMNLLLCRRQDVLILRELPDPAYLKRMRELGCTIPRILVPRQTDAHTPIAELVLQDEELLEELAGMARSGPEEEVYLVSYGVTRLEEAIAERCGLRIPLAPAAVNAALNDKIEARRLAEALELSVCEGRVCSTVEEIREEYERLRASFPRVIIKEPHGASGKGLHIVDSTERLNALLGRLARWSRRHPGSQWLVEGWYSKQLDVNYQIYVSPAGEVDVFSIKQQVLRDTVYIGSRLPAGLDDRLVQSYTELGQRVGRALYSRGFTGVAGIDSIVTAEGELMPLIEINARFTLSTYTSFLSRLLGPESCVFSRYLRLALDRPLDYTGLCRALESAGLDYRPERGEGVIVYTAGTLPAEERGRTGVHSGRLFVLIAASTWERVEAYSTRLELLAAQGFTEALYAAAHSQHPDL